MTRQAKKTNPPDTAQNKYSQKKSIHVDYGEEPN